MGFGLNIGNGGDYLPSIRVNGKDGTITRSTWDGTTRGEETISDLVALFDFSTLKVGWLNFSDGVDKRLVAIGDPLPDRPSEDHKQGIQLVVLLPGGLGAHEICTSATGVLGALETIYDQTIGAPEWNQNKVPVVRLTTFNKEKTKHGTRAVPVFEILDWKDRPDELVAHAATPKPRAAMPSRPAETGSKEMTPPAAKTEPDSIPEFG